MKIVLIIISLSFSVLADATFKFVKGDVVKYIEATSKSIVKKGDALLEDETVELKDEAQVVIKIANHSVQRIEGPAKFTLESLAYTFEDSEEIDQPASLLMETGTFFIKVLKKSDNESMRIKTKSTTFGIRGTEFLLDVPQDKDIILSLNEGSVEVNNNDQKDIISKGGSLFIENDSTFKTLRDPDLRKNINWKFDELAEKKKKFRAFRKNNHSKIRERLKKWNRDDLKWSKYQEKRKEKLAKWKERTKGLKKSKQFERNKLRRKLRKENRVKAKDNNKTRRSELRKNKIEQMKKKRLKNPNSFINEGDRKRMRRRARDRFLKRRNQTSPSSSGTNETGLPAGQ
jgi:hypothetical protein